VGDSDLLQVEMAGLRTFADVVGETGTAYAGEARAQLDGAADVVAQLGQPGGFAEMRWFAELAEADLTVLRTFSGELADGLASTARGAELASRWYERVEDYSTRRLDQLQDALVSGDVPGPSYGGGAAEVSGAPKARGGYPYAPPGPDRTNWAGLDADQIATLVLGARPDAADALAAEWRIAGASIGLAGDILETNAEGLHWFGEGGRTFRRSVTSTVTSTERWQASTTDRAGAYADAAKAISTAQAELRALLGRRGTRLAGLRLDLAAAISPLGQAGVQQQIADAEEAADEQARAIAVRLSGELVTALDGWEPAHPYRGLLGLATAGEGPAAVDEPGSGPRAAAGPRATPDLGPGTGPIAPPGIGPGAGPVGGPPGVGPAGPVGPVGAGAAPLGVFRPASLGTPGISTAGGARVTPRPVTPLPPPAVLPVAPGRGGLLGPGGLVGPVPPGSGRPVLGGYGVPGMAQGVPALGRSADRDPPVRQLAAPDVDAREPTLGSRKDFGPVSRERDGMMPMVPGLFGRVDPAPAARSAASGRGAGAAKPAAPAHLSGRGGPTGVKAVDEPDKRSPSRAPRTPRRGELDTVTRPASAVSPGTRAGSSARRESTRPVPTTSEGGEAHGR